MNFFIKSQYDNYHTLEYVIEFTEPVDLFDVIYQLKILTRNNFIGDVNIIIVCRLSSYKKGLNDNKINRLEIQNLFRNMEVFEILREQDLLDLKKDFWNP